MDQITFKKTASTVTDPRTQGGAQWDDEERVLVSLFA
jgi:hypothetical protein